MAYERHLFAAAQGNWPDLREHDASIPTATAAGQTCMTAWCHGAPGIGLGRLTSLPCLEEREMHQDIAVALETTRAHGFSSNHSLCHGALGNLDLLIEARVRLGRADLQPHINAIAATIVADIRQNGWRCGNPLGVESPGLMTGLAGIGYELLRLAEPTRVPSVLALAPPIGAGARETTRSLNRPTEPSQRQSGALARSHRLRAAVISPAPSIAAACSCPQFDAVVVIQLI